MLKLMVPAATQVGDVVLGNVQAVQAYGAFVELGNGVTGLLHVSQISHDRITQIDKVLSVGDKVKARAARCFMPAPAALQVDTIPQTLSPHATHSTLCCHSKFVVQLSDQPVLLGRR